MIKTKMIKYIAALAAVLLLIPFFAATSVGAQELETVNGTVVLNASQIYERIEAYDKVSATLSSGGELEFVELFATETADKVGFTLDLGGDLDEFKYIGFIVKSSFAGTKFRIRLKDGSGEFTKTVKADSNYAESTWWQAMVVNLSTADEWKENNDSVAVDLLSGFDFDAGSNCQVAAIFLCKTPEDASSIASEFFSGQISAVQKIGDFDELEVGYFYTYPYYQTSVGIMGGNVIYEGTGPEGTSDPYSTWDYKGFAESRGLTPLTTADFKYIVVRYRCQHESKKIIFNIYYQTGERTQAKGNCFAGENYKPTMTWRTILVRFDGKPEWSGDVNSLRIDWASSIPTNTYSRFEVAEFLFFDDLDQAKRYASAVNGIKVSDPEIVVEEDTYEGDAEEELLPWETETELVSEEETLPEYIEESVETEEDQNGDRDEETKLPNPDNTENNEDDSDSEPNKKEGSNAPFAIACVLLALLSIASIVTVIIIRAMDKKKK